MESVRYDWVSAAPFRALVKQLMADHRLPWRVVAVASGVPSGVVRSLLAGSNRKIRHRDAAALLRLESRLVRLKNTPADSWVMTIGLSALSKRVKNVSAVSGLDDFTIRNYLSRGHGLANRLQEAWLLAACEAHGIDPEDVIEAATFDTSELAHAA